MYLHANEALAFEEAIRAAEALCERLAAMAGGSATFAMLLELAERDLDALVVLQRQAGLPAQESQKRFAEADAAVTDLRDIAQAAVAAQRELLGSQPRRPRRECGRERPHLHRRP